MSWAKENLHLFGGQLCWKNPFSLQGLERRVALCCNAPLAVEKAFLPPQPAGHAALGARALWEEQQLARTGHGHHAAGVSRSAGVEANLVCRHFYKVRK